MSSRFVHIPSDVLLSAIKAWGAKVADKGGRFGELAAGHEVAFVMQPAGHQAEVQIYTSVARGEAEARACGEDAVRIVVGVRDKAGKWRNVRRPQKVLRTAPKGAEDKRVAAFVERLRLAVRAAYGHAQGLPRCPDCGALLALRDGREGPFFGCTEYPRCRGTREVGRWEVGKLPKAAPQRPSPQCAAMELRERMDDIAMKHHGCLPGDVPDGYYEEP